MDKTMNLVCRNDLADTGAGEICSEELSLLLMKMTSEFHRMQEERARDFYTAGLRPSHGALLYYLSKRPHRLSELSELTRMRPQSMVKLVNELDELGYVQRVPDPSDTRAKLIRLTSRGLEVMAIARNANREVYKIYANIVGEEDFQHMLYTISVLLHALDTHA